MNKKQGKIAAKIATLCNMDKVAILAALIVAEVFDEIAAEIQDIYDDFDGSPEEQSGISSVMYRLGMSMN